MSYSSEQGSKFWQLVGMGIGVVGAYLTIPGDWMVYSETSQELYPVVGIPLLVIGLGIMGMAARMGQ